MQVTAGIARRRRRRAQRLARLRVDLPEGSYDAARASRLLRIDTCLRQLLIGDALSLAGLHARAQSTPAGEPQIEGTWYDAGSPAMN